jgi:hypothetical protein
MASVCAKIWTENGVMIDWSANILAQVALRLARSQKVARDQFGSLMGPASVWTRVSPLSTDFVGFHVSLLKVRGKSAHVLIVGENSDRFGTEKAVARRKKSSHRMSALMDALVVIAVVVLVVPLT